MNYNINLITDKLNLKSTEQIESLKSVYDYEQTGAAPILGINGLVLKSHGASSRISIFNALKTAKKLSGINLISKFQF